VLPESSTPAMMLLKMFMPASFVSRRHGHIGKNAHICPGAANSHRHHLTHRSISIHFSGVAAAYGTAL
jgi:hypothetical protein